MRKGLILIVVLSFIILLCSCSGIYEEKVINDPSKYQSIWTLPERRVDDETSLLFPDSIEGKQVIDFYCKHTTYSLVGTGWQVELRIKYEDESFIKEVERLKNMCEVSVICGESDYFDAPAYASVWNWNDCFEYAVVNEEDKTVGYVYLQLINKDDLEIDSDLVPDKYDEISDSQIYTAYLKDAS